MSDDPRAPLVTTIVPREHQCSRCYKRATQLLQYAIKAKGGAVHRVVEQMCDEHGDAFVGEHKGKVRVCARHDEGVFG